MKISFGNLEPACREVTLYAVSPGSSCVLSTAGILKDSSFPATAVTEADTRILLLPKTKVKSLYEKYPGWRDFILSLYTDRVSAVIHLVEEVLFRRLDDRLLNYTFRSRSDTSGCRSGFTDNNRKVLVAGPDISGIIYYSFHQNLPHLPGT